VIISDTSGWGGGGSDANCRINRSPVPPKKVAGLLARSRSQRSSKGPFPDSSVSTMRVGLG
jgi:hypothetical protein